MTKRANAAYIEASFERECVTAILGPRRVGKTFDESVSFNRLSV